MDMGVSEAMAKANSSSSVGGRSSGWMGKGVVLVRGFDHGTTEEQLANYMSVAGRIVNLQMIDRGSACITYSTAEEAHLAAQGFDQTTIPGNSRFISVSGMDPEGFLIGYSIDMDKAMQFKALSPEAQQIVMAKGSLASARDPNAVLTTRMKQATSMGGIGGMVKSTSGPQAAAGRGSVGPCVVLVKGFDHGTTEEQIAGYMSGAGTIVNLQMLDKGTACITYNSPQEAQAAVQGANQTIIPGNTRYIDVSSQDPQQFLAGFNIEVDKSTQFMSMSPEQQQSIMAKGSLATARDPNAVLATRMKQAMGMGNMGMASGLMGIMGTGMGGMGSMGQVGGGGKGSFGPAQGCGGGMKGGAGSSPYGGIGSDQGGSTGQGGKGGGGKMAALNKVAQILSEFDWSDWGSDGDWGSNDGSGWW